MDMISIHGDRIPLFAIVVELGSPIADCTDACLFEASLARSTSNTPAINFLGSVRESLLNYFFFDDVSVQWLLSSRASSPSADAPLNFSHL